MRRSLALDLASAGGYDSSQQYSSGGGLQQKQQRGINSVESGDSGDTGFHSLSLPDESASVSQVLFIRGFTRLCYLAVLPCCAALLVRRYSLPFLHHFLLF